jgi:hypothetical protein
MGRAREVLVLLFAVGVLVSATMTGAQAAVVEPSLRLIGPSGEVTMIRYGRGEPVYMDLGVMIGSTGAPLELLAQRPDYSQPQTLTQILYGQGNDTDSRPLDPALLDGWNGLKDFFEISFVKNGSEVVAMTQPFCPGGFQRERLDDSGPDVPTYPSGCYANPFTKGVVWGIDAGWAAGSSGGVEPPLLDIPNGLYTVTVTIAEPFTDAFSISAENASARFAVRIQTVRDFECGPRCRHRARMVGAAEEQAAQQVPVVDSPDADTLPDLIALPSWGINVENRRERATLTFGATVWNGGAADLVVEGFRRSDEAIMDGFQYFYDGDEVVGKAAAGELEYDDRDGHDHWHFKQFAAYSLLDADGNEVRKSRKEAFCLAPTDAIDMTLPEADWNPGSIGLHTACGGPNSIWTREILPLGWGDTYFQGLPGQSFWITNLPNGTYFIKTEANPGGLLYETTDANNVELREITLSGRAGNRKVTVPPWNGIDTEIPRGGGVIAG